MPTEGGCRNDGWRNDLPRDRSAKPSSPPSQKNTDSSKMFCFRDAPQRLSCRVRFARLLLFCCCCCCPTTTTIPIAAKQCIFTLSSHIRAGRWYRSGLCSKIGFSRIPSAKMYTLAIVDTFS